MHSCLFGCLNGHILVRILIYALLVDLCHDELMLNFSCSICEFRKEYSFQAGMGTKIRVVFEILSFLNQMVRTALVLILHFYICLA